MALRRRERSLENRWRVAYLASIRDHEERTGRPRTADVLRRVLARDR